jgi:hypothetical protein
MFYIALFVLIVMASMLLVIKHTKSPRDEMYILLIHYTGKEIEEAVRRALGTNPYKIKSKTMRRKDIEMAIEVRVKRNNTAFVDVLQTVEGVVDLTLVQYNGDYID